MANETATAAVAGPRMVKIDVVSATVINGAIVSEGSKGVEVSEIAARGLLQRGKAVLSKGEEIDLTGPLSFGAMRADADGDGIDDRVQAAEGDTGRGGPPTAEGDPGSGKFDATEPPAGAVDTVSSVTKPMPGLTPQEQADIENRKVKAAEATAKEKEAQAARAKADAAKPAKAGAKTAATKTAGEK